MVWYGMVWYGLVWFGQVRCGVVRYGLVRFSKNFAGKNKMKTYKVKIQGTSPLLMNKPSEAMIGEKSKSSKRETMTIKENGKN